ncbi:ROK family protein [Mucilaginibacter sp. NFR10]|uniref:ROK family protein n=1 Tax=Mucilaginibacter sp. NFR10 TaxID=1566292 RepID=UPI00087182C0|nr:ROK family protein [Mucilaginibacter sp. NFR10]SCW87699.1 glucokinase [Mucilaginibacter sp. NFR10]
MQNCYIGIEIGGTKLQIVLADDSFIINRTFRFAVDRVLAAAGIREHIAQTITNISKEYIIKSISIGFGGPVDREAGCIAKSHQLSGWDGFNISGWLQQQVNVPVILENDANAAALGEALKGAGRNYEHVFYVTLGSGTGAGMVINGQIYHGTKPGEAEIGHIRLNREGLTLEDSCSGWAVDKKIRTVIAQKPDGKLAQLCADVNGGEAKMLLTALEQGDADALKILNDTAADLGFGLSHAVHLFHPDIIVLGGGLSLLGEPLRVRVQNAIRANTMTLFLPGPGVVIAELGELAVPVGAIENLRRHIG